MTSPDDQVEKLTDGGFRHRANGKDSDYSPDADREPYGCRQNLRKKTTEMVVLHGGNLYLVSFTNIIRIVTLKRRGYASRNCNSRSTRVRRRMCRGTEGVCYERPLFHLSLLTDVIVTMYSGLGILLIIFGSLIIYQPAFYDRLYGIYFDFTGYNIPLGIFIIIVGIGFIWTSVRGKSRK
jgi:hypothetical protein